jgi:hypothetical protein
MSARVNASWSIFSSLLILFLLALQLPANAQMGNATVSGTVTDTSGAAVVGAQLTLTNKAQQFEQKFISNDRGEYTFRNLTPGTYDLSVVMAGFQKSIQSDIVLTLNQSGHADVTLKAGATTEPVNVEGQNTSSTTNGTVQGGIDPWTVKDLPLIETGQTSFLGQLSRCCCPGSRPAAVSFTRESMAAFNPGMRHPGRRQHAGRLHEPEWHGFDPRRFPDVA